MVAQSVDVLKLFLIRSSFKCGDCKQCDYIIMRLLHLYTLYLFTN